MLLDKLFSMAGQGNNHGTNGVHFPFGQALSNGCRSKKLVIFKILHISDAIKAIPINLHCSAPCKSMPNPLNIHIPP